MSPVPSARPSAPARRPHPTGGLASLTPSQLEDAVQPVPDATAPPGDHRERLPDSRAGDDPVPKPENDDEEERNRATGGEKKGTVKHLMEADADEDQSGSQYLKLGGQRADGEGCELQLAKVCFMAAVLQTLDTRKAFVRKTREAAALRVLHASSQLVED